MQLDEKQSPIWDQRHGLPLAPLLNNPWIYMAYALRVLDRHPMINFRASLHPKLQEYGDKTLLSNGTRSRWPGSTDLTSHDEILGMCYLDLQFAEDVLSAMKPWGFYETRPGPLTFKQRWEAWVPRFPWMPPFIRASVGDSDLFSRLIWSVCLIFDALTFHERDAGGRLRWWIQFDTMSDHNLCLGAIRFWVSRHEKRGITLEAMLRLEPREYPELADAAKGRSWFS